MLSGKVQKVSENTKVILIITVIENPREKKAPNPLFTPEKSKMYSSAGKKLGVEAQTIMPAIKQSKTIIVAIIILPFVCEHCDANPSLNLEKSDFVLYDCIS